MRRLPDILLYILGTALVLFGTFTIILSIRVFGARIRHLSDPVLPEELDRYLNFGQQSKDGMLLGASLVIIGVTLFWIRGLISRLQRHLASRR